MRPTCEIVADLKDGKEVTHEELKMACLVQSAIIFFYQQDIKSLMEGGISADLKKKMEYSDPETSSPKAGIPSWYWKAMKKDPMEWLGDAHIPGTEQWEALHGMFKRLKKETEKN